MQSIAANVDELWPQKPGGGTNELRLDGVWLDDLIELRRDHQVLKSLMRLASDEADAADRGRTALSLCIELFSLHVRAERMVPGVQELDPAVEGVQLLMEQLDSMLRSAEPVDEPLLLTRVCTLDEHLSLLFQAEDDCYNTWSRPPATGGTRALPLDPDLCRRRSTLLYEADNLLKSAPPPASGDPR